LIPEEFITKVPEVHEALEELKVMSMDEEFRAAYDAHIKAKNDQTSREANARAEGIEKGRAEGITEGELKGKREMALGLLRAGVDLAIIAQTSGLSVEEIEPLKVCAAPDDLEA
jgi:predicted transposase/invertase (TIGR01784 family)